MFIFKTEKKKKLLFILLVLFLASCAPANAYCPPRETKNILKDFSRLDRNWTVAYNFAGKAKKAELDGAIDGLVAIKEEVISIDVPECLEPAKIAFSNYMQRIIEGFTAIKAGESAVSVEKKFDSSDIFLDEYSDHIYTIQSCLPDCKKLE
jgi:hypothetical protein